MTTEDNTVDSETYFAQLAESIAAIEHPDIEGLSLDFKAPPAEPEKRGRQAKVVLAWEEYLEFLIEMPGEWIQVFSFSGDNAKGKAQARKRSLTSRLNKTQIDRIWEVKVAADRDANGKETGVFGVYANYVRPATQAEINDRNAKHDAAVERGKHAAASRVAKAA